MLFPLKIFELVNKDSSLSAGGKWLGKRLLSRNVTQFVFHWFFTCCIKLISNKDCHVFPLLLAFSVFGVFHLALERDLINRWFLDWQGVLSFFCHMPQHLLSLQRSLNRSKQMALWLWPETITLSFIMISCLMKHSGEHESFYPVLCLWGCMLYYMDFFCLFL